MTEFLIVFAFTLLFHHCRFRFSIRKLKLTILHIAEDHDLWILRDTIQFNEQFYEFSIFYYCFLNFLQGMFVV